MQAIHVSNQQAPPDAANESVSILGDKTASALIGDMGAGKTTFIKENIRAIGQDGGDYQAGKWATTGEYRFHTTVE